MREALGAIVAAAAILLLPKMADAIPITYQFEADLIGFSEEEAIQANIDSGNFPNGVDFVGKLEPPPDFGSFETLPGLDGFPGTLSADCTLAKEGDDPSDCIAFEWSFDNSTLASDWQIVKIGIKAGNTTGYWLVEPFTGAEGGPFEFSCATYSELFGGDGSVCLPDNQLTGISNISFFGTPGVNDVPEPAALALLGLGLVGVGLMRRRRRDV